MPSSSALREYGESKIARLEKYYNGILDVKVTFSAGKTSQKAEVTLKANGITIRGEDSASDAYAALDSVIDKLSIQLRKHHDKIKGHQAPPAAEVAAGKTGARAKAPAAKAKAKPARPGKPRITETDSYSLKPMFPDDAIMQMGLSGDDFMVFINAETSGVSVIYRRPDGHYGLVEPE